VQQRAVQRRQAITRRRQAQARNGGHD
jgi:hypothetical protein